MMTIFDHNVHLISHKDISRDKSLIPRKKHIEHAVTACMQNSFVGCNLMVMNTSLDSDELSEITKFNSDNEHVSVTVCLDPKNKNEDSRLRKLISVGFKNFKFHSYFSEISEAYYPNACYLSQIVEENNGCILVCCSYGTSSVHEIVPTKLLAKIAQVVVKAPVIALHAGGGKVVEAMSIGLDCKNIYFDTSFSIPFWLGSSIESDLAFCFEKIGSDRIIFGSDYPYVGQKESLEATKTFLLNNCGFDHERVQAVISRRITR